MISLPFRTGCGYSKSTQKKGRISPVYICLSWSAVEIFDFGNSTHARFTQKRKPKAQREWMQTTAVCLSFCLSVFLSFCLSVCKRFYSIIHESQVLSPKIVHLSVTIHSRYSARYFQAHFAWKSGVAVRQIRPKGVFALCVPSVCAFCCYEQQSCE